MSGMDSDYYDEDEEQKYYEDSDGNRIAVYDPDQEDEGFDYNGDNLVSDTIRQVMKDQEQILAADKAGTAAALNKRGR